MRVAIYIRVSTLDQAREGYSLAAQRAALEHWAADRRHEIVRVYEDAESARRTSSTARPCAGYCGRQSASSTISCSCGRSRGSRAASWTFIQPRELLGQHKIALVSYTEAIDTLDADRPGP